MQKTSIPFKLDLRLLARLLETISEGASTYEHVAQQLGIGQPKVRFFCYWGMVLSLVESVEAATGLPYRVTETYSQVKGHLAEFGVMQFLYSLACSNHLILSFVVNDFAWSRVERGSYSFSSLELRQEAATALGLSDESLRRQIPIQLGTLTDRNGFGNLGIIKKQKDRYEICSFQPHPLCAAFVIYNNWPQYTAKVAIKEVVSGRNNLGRIFFLNEISVMAVLRQLENRGVVKIETVAGLDQIGISRRFALNDFWNMLLVEDAR